MTGSMLKGIGRDHLGRMAGRGAWAIIERGLFALTTLATSLILARSLSAENFGAFGTCFATLLLVSSVQDSMLSEPMLVLGSSRYRNSIGPYVSTVIGWHWSVSALSGTLLLMMGAGASLIDSATALAPAFGAAGIAALGLLYLSLVRAVCYLREEPNAAAVGGAINLALVLAGLVALTELNIVSSASAFLLMGAASFLAGACILRRLGLSALGSRGALALAPIRREHWNYGRWVLGSSITSWATGNLYFVILPAIAGFSAGGALLALMLFTRPVMTMLMPLGLVIVPPLVRARGRPEFARYLTVVLAALSGAAAVYWAGLAAGHDVLVNWIFAGKYDANSYLLIILGALPLIWSVSQTLTSGLRALGRPDLEFRACMVSAAVSLTAGIALVYLRGLDGAAVALVLSSASVPFVMAYALHRELSRQARG